MNQFKSDYMSFANNLLKGDNDGMTALSDEFSVETVQQIQRFQKTHPNYQETPLHNLENLANHLQIKNILVKDESQRFGLNAFKVLGGIYAIGKYLANTLNHDINRLSFSDLTSEATKQKLGKLTFITATDGNHGRGVAWAARELGQSAVVYMPKGASSARVQAIEQEGAKVKVINGNYDTAVAQAAKTAKENGWIVLQDTSWENYEDIPFWIMQGYSSIGQEIIEQLWASASEQPTHIFLQAGVGSYAASIAAFMTNYYKDERPKIILVEPDQANCYYHSFLAGGENYQTVGGDLQTIMAGLSCGVPNPKAWEILKKFADGGISANDRLAALGMRVLGQPLKGDPSVISGESGAATMGVVYHLLTDQQYEPLREHIAIDGTSSILLINTEGDTDAAHYREIVWQGAFAMKD